MRARAFIVCGAVFGLACVKRVESEEELTARIAAGNVMQLPGGVGNRIGAPVHIEMSFKDGSPNCVMHGAVQDSRDSSHRWVWLEPGEGCPGWLSGRWWAELAAGGSGWYVKNISTKPVTEAGR